MTLRMLSPPVWVTIGVLLFLLPAMPAFCQDTDQNKPNWENTIETDGPDFTEASSVVPKNTFQLETGVMFFKETPEKTEVKTLAYPATLLRFGLLENTELRLIGEYNSVEVVEKETNNKQTINGLAPIQIGTKIFICEEKGLRPETAFLGHLVLPSGSRQFRPAYVAPAFRLAFTNTITEKVEIGYNLGYEWDGDSPQGQGIYTVALGYALSQRLSLYAEVFGDKPEGDQFANVAAGGIKFLLAPNWQMDVSGGKGLDSRAFDYYLAYGFRLRLPY